MPLFFLLSGFCLTLRYGKKKQWTLCQKTCTPSATTPAGCKCHQQKNAKGRYLYDVRKLIGFFLPQPPCHVQNSRNLVPFVCFMAYPLPHPLRTSYKYAPQGLRLPRVLARKGDQDLARLLRNLRVCLDLGAVGLRPGRESEGRCGN